MSTEGWLTMVISIGGVLIISTWCFYKIFASSPKKEEVHGIDLITPDMDDDETAKH
ncbi:MAG: hypothetical protein RR553_05755 [Akkermansia sp.]